PRRCTPGRPCSRGLRRFWRWPALPHKSLSVSSLLSVSRASYCTHRALFLQGLLSLPPNLPENSCFPGTSAPSAASISIDSPSGADEEEEPMKQKKTLLAVAVVLALLALTLAGCGSNT